MMKLAMMVLWMFWSGMAWAAFQVTPMRLELESGGHIGNVTVYNSADESLNVQIKAKAWSQDNITGADQLSSTQELIFFPKIFTIPAHGKKNIRVGYQGEVTGHERSYRLFIRELPVKKPGLSGAQFVLQISMPVFIYPIGSQKPRKPDMRAIKVHDGALVVEAVNESPRYYSLNKLEVVGKHGGRKVFQDKKSGWYVLSGSKRLFPLGITKKQCLTIDAIQLTGHVLLTQSEEGDTSRIEFPLNPELCQQIKVKSNSKSK